MFHVPLWQSRLLTHLLRHVFANFSGEFHVPTLSESADLLRDIFGNPFHPVTFDPAWRTPGVSSLARRIHDALAFDRMPSLADALEELGCRDAEILSHCRVPTGHVRGCWVIDVILGLGCGD
mgnify:CR=1 FL=1